jgi:hypothetical protein
LKNARPRAALSRACAQTARVLLLFSGQLSRGGQEISESMTGCRGSFAGRPCSSRHTSICPISANAERFRPGSPMAISNSLSFAKSLRRHQKDFFLLDVSSPDLDACDSSPGERCLQRMSTVPRQGFKKKSLVFRKTALESRLPPHNDGAARRV